MYDNNRGGGSRGGRDFDRRGSSDRQMHDATCAKCGSHCKVPFMPSSGKPVFCSDCFESQGGGNNRGGGRDFSSKRSFSDRPSRPQAPQVDYSQQFATLTKKLDTIIEMLVIKNIKATEVAEDVSETVETEVEE